MQRKGEHLSAQFSDSSCFQRPQVGEEFFRIMQSARVRPFQPAELCQIVNTSRLQREHYFGQVQSFYLRQLLWSPMAMLLPGPQPEANSGSGSAGSASPLVGGSLANLFHQKRVNPTIRIIAGNSCQTAVDHTTHTVDGQRSLSYIRSYYDFAMIIPGYCGILVGGRQLSV